MNKEVKPRSAARKKTAAVKKAPKAPKATLKKGTKAAASKKLSAEELQARTAQKAYEIFQQRGGTHGNDFNDWLEAEKRVLVEV